MHACISLAGLSVAQLALGAEPGAAGAAALAEAEKTAQRYRRAAIAARDKEEERMAHGVLVDIAKAWRKRGMSTKAPPAAPPSVDEHGPGGAHAAVSRTGGSVSMSEGPPARCARPGCIHVPGEKCSGCLAIGFCSVECQKAAWSAHRPVCKAAQKAQRLAAAADTAASTG